MVYSTVHARSVDAFFNESKTRNLRRVTGKMLMDRNCPEFLRDTAESGIRHTEDLLKKWHKRGRQLYAITPHFAPTSPDAQMQLAGELAGRYLDIYFQTHLAENADEVVWVKSLYPEALIYLDVYEKFGVLRPLSM